ncbi:MAG: YgjP-like metallopeptidase domain-containing protein [Eubacterium callanderi]
MTPYRVRRSRRKTIAIHILPDGQVEVRAPLRTSPKFLDRFVQEKAEWIEKASTEARKRHENGRHLY